MQLLPLNHKQVFQTHFQVQTEKLKPGIGLSMNHDIFIPTRPTSFTAAHFGATHVMTEYVPDRISLHEIKRAVGAHKEGALCPSYVELMIPLLQDIIEVAEDEGIQIKPINEKLPKSTGRHGYFDEATGYVPGKLGPYELDLLSDAYINGLPIPGDLEWLAQYYYWTYRFINNNNLDAELANKTFSINNLDLMMPTVQNLPEILKFIADVDAASGMPPEYFESQKAHIEADLKKSQRKGRYFLVRDISDGKMVGLAVYHAFIPREGLEDFAQEGKKIAELNALYTHLDLQGHRQKLSYGVQTFRYSNRISLATTLYKAMEKMLRIEGYDQIVLETSVLHERAPHFYEKMGFKKVKEPNGDDKVTRDGSGNEFFVYAKKIKEH